MKIAMKNNNNNLSTPLAVLSYIRCVLKKNMFLMWSTWKKNWKKNEKNMLKNLEHNIRNSFYMLTFVWKIFRLITNLFVKKRLFQFSILQMGSAAGATQSPFEGLKIETTFFSKKFVIKRKICSHEC